VQTIICMKWGTRYGPEFVNRLFNAIQRHTQRKTRLVRFTDDGDILFLDLDLAITGNLDDLFDDEPSRFCVIQNWPQLGKAIGNKAR